MSESSTPTKEAMKLAHEQFYGLDLEDYTTGESWKTWPNLWSPSRKGRMQPF